MLRCPGRRRISPRPLRRLVLQPTVDELRRRGTPFVGALYAGLALTPRGARVMEFNARFGDPETQAVLALLQTPLSAVLYAAAVGTLESLPPLRWRDGAAVAVVVAAAGYPESPRTGDVLDGIDEAAEISDAYVLHAGTRRDADGRLASSGGRVLSIVGTGRDVAEARARAYEAAALIRLDGSHSAPTSRWRPSAARFESRLADWHDRSGIEKHRVARSWFYRSSRNRWRSDEHGHKDRRQVA